MKKIGLFMQSKSVSLFFLSLALCLCSMLPAETPHILVTGLQNSLAWPVFLSFRPYLNANKREVLADYALPVAVIVLSFIGSYVFRDVKRKSPQMTSFFPSPSLLILIEQVTYNKADRLGWISSMTSILWF